MRQRFAPAPAFRGISKPAKQGGSDAKKFQSADEAKLEAAKNGTAKRDRVNKAPEEGISGLRRTIQRTPENLIYGQIIKPRLFYRTGNNRSFILIE